MATACLERQAETDTSIEVSQIKIVANEAFSAEADSIIAPYKTRLDSIMNEVIGHASHELTTNGVYESTLGTFVTQLCLERSRTFFDQEVDVAIMNHRGGLRAPINQGDITLGEVFQVMPFENEMLLLEVPGNVLLEVIEHIAESGRSMIVPVSFDVDKDDVSNILIAGEELDPNRTYVLSISDYLANGGGGFFMLRPMERINAGTIKLRDMIINEIRDRTARGESVAAELPLSVNVINP